MIHALMPMKAAAQAACVSTDFLRSWRSYPKLILSIDSLGINKDTTKKDEIQRDFTSRVEHIMQNHSGKGIKKFSLQTYPCSILHPSYVDRWLQIAAKPGIEEFELEMFGSGDIKYNFPCHLLSTEWGSCIQSFALADCSFHAAAQISCMRSLKELDLRSVHLTGEELYGFLSNCCGLEHFNLSRCKDIVCLKIPHLLRQLNTLTVLCCGKLEIIDSNAPMLSTFTYVGHPIHISLGDALEVKKVKIFHQHYSPGAIYYARTKLPFITPYLQTLVLSSRHEEVNTPGAIGRFLHLKYLEIKALTPSISTDYDFCSLVSFLDASPTLETFVLRIGMSTVRSNSIVDASDGDVVHQRVSERCHDNLKKVMITGFCSAKSLIALTIHIIERTKSLECLTLDTTQGYECRHANIAGCLWLNKDVLIEATKALVGIRRYVEGRVPSAVNLKVIGPCSKCTGCFKRC